jgi:electron transfer flavoprotein alpha subunit
MTTLLIAENDGGTLSGQTAMALTAALALGEPVDLLVAGRNAAAVAQEASALAGIARVLLAEAEALAGGLAEPMADLVVSLAPNYGAIVAPASTSGKNLLPRVAALLDVMQISDISAVVDARTFKRPIYAGNATATVQSSDPIRVITVRTASFPAAPAGGSAPVEALDFAGASTLSQFVRAETVKSDRPDLGMARIVVSGGRAFGSKEKFDELLVPLADRLGAAIGASRAAVDAGDAATDMQVGQTGRIVAPDLYIACGISGAIQHLAGIKDARVIVAINKDADAPIFQIADYGLVGDIFELLPELEKALRNA